LACPVPSIWAQDNTFNLDQFYPGRSTIAGVGDFNGDGKSDILWYNTTSGAMEVFYSGVNSGTKYSLGPIAPSTGWRIAGIGDFDGDGKSDILWYNITTGDLSVWPAANVNANYSPGNVGIHSDWVVAGTGDFKGTGKSDILWFNTVSKSMQIWPGGSTNGKYTVGYLSSGWTISQIADFNGDGKSDILLYNTQTGQVLVWYGAVDSGTANNIGTAAPNSLWIIVQAGDFDGDGKADILWYNTQSGQFAVWEDGTAVNVAAPANISSQSDWVVAVNSVNNSVPDGFTPLAAPIVYRPTTQSASQSAPLDEREIMFPANMAAWGWLDVTKNGAAIGCYDALPGKTDAGSVNQTTQAIQCRLNQLGIGNVPASLYFPRGSYYINQTLSLTEYYYVNGVLTPWGQGDRSNWTGEVHISGEGPTISQIIWAGSCGTDPNIADPSTITKYNDIFYVDAVAPLIMERLTLDGKNCAGDGIDMVSKPGNMSNASINEMIIQNLKEVGIVGDRNNLTKDEVAEGDGTGMVSEVSVTNVHFNNVGYACVMPDAANAVDWWVRDSVFNNCNIGLVTTDKGAGAPPGFPTGAGLAWGNGGYGNFQVANSFFENSKIADIVGGTSARNNFSIASHGPFLESYGNFYAQGNTVIASKGVMPVVHQGGIQSLHVGQLMLFQNKFVTQDNEPAVTVWTGNWGLPASYAIPGASASVQKAWDATYSMVASVGNEFTSTAPFATESGYQSQYSNKQCTDEPGWTPSAAIQQCSPAGVPGAYQDGRSYCTLIGSNDQTDFNLLTYDDKYGVEMAPVAPVLAPFRPEITRSYIIPALNPNYSLEATSANAVVLQNAINTLVANQAGCAASDYGCPDRWAYLFIPSGLYGVSETLTVPVSAQIQIVGSGESNLYWFSPPGQKVAAPVIKVKAPSHVVIRDIALFGENDIHEGGAMGQPLVAEVSDLATSRVFSDNLRLWGGMDSLDIGNAVFEMRSFGMGQSSTTSSITGNNGSNKGYFAFFGGNPWDITIGRGMNLMVQDVCM
jgi:hypothetical protein